jgi:hypothetical protein
MITITEQPSECINGIDCFNIKMETDAYLAQLSTPGYLAFTLPAVNASTGDTIAISINGVSELFTFTSGIPLPPNMIGIGGDRDATIQVVIDMFQSHYIMSFFTRVYKTTALGADFVVIEWENNNIIELDTSGVNNIGSSFSPATQYLAPAASPNYSMYASLIKDNNIIFSTSDIYVDLEQKATLNLADFFKGYLKSSLPDLNTGYTLLDDFSDTLDFWISERDYTGQIWRTGTGTFKVVRSFKDVECNEFMNEFDQYGNTIGINTYEFCSDDMIWLYFVREAGTNSDFTIRFSTLFSTITDIVVPSSANTNVIAINISRGYLEGAGIFNPASQNGLFVGVDSGNGFGSFAGFRYNDVYLGFGERYDKLCCGTEQLLFLTKKGIFESIRLNLVSSITKAKKSLYAKAKGCKSENKAYAVDISETFEFVTNKLRGKDTIIDVIKELHSSKEIYWIVDGTPVLLSDKGGTLKVKLNQGNEFEFSLDIAQIEKY